MFRNLGSIRLFVPVDLHVSRSIWHVQLPFKKLRTSLTTFCDSLMQDVLMLRTPELEIAHILHWELPSFVLREVEICVPCPSICNDVLSHYRNSTYLHSIQICYLWHNHYKLFRDTQLCSSVFCSIIINSTRAESHDEYVRLACSIDSIDAEELTAHLKHNLDLSFVLKTHMSEQCRDACRYPYAALFLFPYYLHVHHAPLTSCWKYACPLINFFESYCCRTNFRQPWGLHMIHIDTREHFSRLRQRLSLIEQTHVEHLIYDSYLISFRCSSIENQEWKSIICCHRCITCIVIPSLWYTLSSVKGISFHCRNDDWIDNDMSASHDSSPIAVSSNLDCIVQRYCHVITDFCVVVKFIAIFFIQWREKCLSILWHYLENCTFC